MKIKNLLCLLILGFLSSCGYFYKSDKNIEKDGILYIYPNSTYNQVMDSLSHYVLKLDKFEQVAKFLDYDKNVKAGRYKISKDDTNESLINRLKRGETEDVKVRIKNYSTIFHLAGDVSQVITADSVDIVKAILDNSKFKSENLNIETSKIYFIPNTYFFKWITTGDEFVERMITEHDKFWNQERLNKLKKSGMSELEVYTLASIVQLESSKVDEQPKIAKAYLNRLKKGMKLQADPTSVYAYKIKNGFDESIRRVYNQHLETESEYNTYQVVGLPPAPIALPNGTAIDAVLNPDNHDYIYFAADPDRPGYHSFAKTYSEHQVNANKYRAWLRENNIK